MKQIQDTTATTIRPTTSSTGTTGFFKYNPGGTGTKVTADWLNDIQGQFVDLFSRTGITQVAGSAGDRNLYDAIQALITPLVAGLFTSGTVMAFGQATAPTGWTIITDDRATNRMLRFTNVNAGTAGLNGTGGGAWGGTSSPILNNTVASHTHTFSDTTSLTTVAGAHTHTDSFSIANAGNHSHTYTDRYYPESSIRDGGTWTTIPSGAGSNSTDFDNVVAKYTTDTTDPHNGHVHTLNGAVLSVAGHQHNVAVSGTTSVNTALGDWVPRYFNMILASKN